MEKEPQSDYSWSGDNKSSGLSIKELKQELKGRGIDHSACVEKAELEALYQRTMPKSKEPVDLFSVNSELFSEKAHLFSSPQQPAPAAPAPAPTDSLFEEPAPAPAPAPVDDDELFSMVRNLVFNLYLISCLLSDRQA